MWSSVTPLSKPSSLLGKHKTTCMSQNKNLKIAFRARAISVPSFHELVLIAVFLQHSTKLSSGVSPATTTTAVLVLCETWCTPHLTKASGAQGSTLCAPCAMQCQAHSRTPLQLHKGAVQVVRIHREVELSAMRFPRDCSTNERQLAAILINLPSGLGGCHTWNHSYHSLLGLNGGGRQQDVVHVTTANANPKLTPASPKISPP